LYFVPAMTQSAAPSGAAPSGRLESLVDPSGVLASDVSLDPVPLLWLELDRRS
jgi:hypothetical protein